MSEPKLYRETTHAGGLGLYITVKLHIGGKSYHEQTLQ